MDVKIRPLRLGDHKTSWKWRNDKQVWKYTGNRPNKTITKNIEKKWLAEALKKRDQKRFAISVGKAGEYIGNAQLTNVTKKRAQYHIFIGNRKYWGKGIATKVTQKIIDYASNELNLNSIYLYVDPKNLPAINAYKKCGFISTGKDRVKGIKMIKKLPKVTILCITYNQEKYIAQALDSFLMQKTDFNYEILIHDDASTDNTVEIIKRYKKENPDKIKTIFETENQFSKKGGFYMVVNILDSIKSKYIAICEGDDFWTDKKKLQVQKNFMDNNMDYALCVHPTMVIYDNQEKPPTKTPDFSNNIKNIHFDELLETNFIQTSSVLYRKQRYKTLIKKNIFPGDYYLHLYHASFGKIGYINKIMSVHRMHSGGVWWSSFKNPDMHLIKNGLSLLNLYSELLVLFNYEPKYKEILEEKMFTLIDNLHKINSYKKIPILIYIILNYPRYYYLLSKRAFRFFP